MAWANKLPPADISGGTITLSNIGSIGGKFGSPLINVPEVAIIALGRIQKVAHFKDDGTVYPVSIMTASLVIIMFYKFNKSIKVVIVLDYHMKLNCFDFF